jgi:FMN phosphatase YigB (HAD superfamily)
MAGIEQIEAVFCDLDGTLCDVKHRQHLAQAGQWDEFHSLLALDEPRPMVWAFLQMLSDLKSTGMPGPIVVFLTGRPRNTEGATARWLAEKCDLHLSDEYDCILMRPDGDYRSDTLLKQELLDEFLSTSDIDPRSVLILDDREKVVAHLRDIGYDVWQVQEGAF